MREFNFRVWDEKHNKFLYFDLNCLEILTADEIDLIGRSEKEQCLEYKDKNKIKIYEGDIVKYFIPIELGYESLAINVVEFEEDRFRLSRFSAEKYFWNKMEIIGRSKLK